MYRFICRGGGWSVCLVGGDEMAAMSYEEARKQRMDENKRRMEELGLVDLSKNLKQLKPKIPAKKPEKRKIDSQEARRSSRVASKPVVSYKEQLDRVRGIRETRVKKSSSRRKLTESARMATIEAANEVIKGIEYPAFVKPMQHSNTSNSFWLGIPADFCKERMPLADEKFILEDENGKEWECLYLAHKEGITGGWRKFLLDNELEDGDCCIFELKSPLRFKVHVLKWDEEDNDLEELVGKKSSKAVTKKKSGKRKARRFEIEDGEEDEDEEDEEDDDDDEEFDSDICDDDSDSHEDDEDSEDDYSPRLTEKEVDTLVAAPSRVSRVPKRKTAEEDDDDSEGHTTT
ncbi:B3 domain-containing protein Os03g0184500 isoform X2 [Physcomitrium patens]|uniref:TF-B3 domain-containing protein n=1 Tax=Physcomitrium patens TaxID=3218 RepID=A0A2K1IM07_PHYPA|nr:B3 domain-containing protein Os03g0184500-like [Physcomitrium patens]PNR30306.1 hypothetical protein PHYPA_026622 [Physcomitrium patens]|eukprot:XP_024360739.1 B3 domain-containing protein Os03g0184500-like [Physcomitrella patens]